MAQPTEGFGFPAAEAKGAVETALAEDLGDRGDITTEVSVPQGIRGAGLIVAQADGVVAGMDAAAMVFSTVDSHLSFEAAVCDGEAVAAGTPLAAVEGAVASILAAERTALNFLGHLSGIATLTSKYVAAAAPYGAAIRDTRKTLPGLRALEKYAVRAGGGENHRLGLHDAILLKDNHLALMGDALAEALKTAVAKARSLRPQVTVEIEAEDLGQVKEALEAGADVIMLDNMDIATIGSAVDLVGGRAKLEVSGGVTLGDVAKIAACGVDWISVGIITQGAPPLDIHLEMERGELRG